MAGVVVGYFAPSLAPLTKDRGSYVEPPQPDPVSLNWWERLGEQTSEHDSPENKARARQRLDDRALWARENGVALFGAIVAHTLTTIQLHHGAFIIYGPACGEPWCSLPLGFFV